MARRRQGGTGESDVDKIQPPPIRPLRARDPQQCGPWLLQGRIGAGGMGTVYLAEHKDTGAPAAVKVMSDALADDDNFRSRFAREVDVLELAKGPFISHVLDSDPSADPPWLATEYIHGPDLARFVSENGPLDEESWNALAVGLITAVSSLHQAGIVHRDLKPGNVLLSVEGPELIDFGIAQLRDATALTTTGLRLGTEAWMSPEQLQGGKASPAGDLFSIGALLVFSSTGRPPFGQDSPGTVINAILQNEPNFDGIPEQAEPLLAGLLQKDPNLRWTAQQASQELMGTNDAPTMAYGATAIWQAADITDALPHDAPTVADFGETVETTARNSGRRKWPWIVAAATSLALIGALSIPIFTSQTPDISATDPTSSPSASPTPSPTESPRSRQAFETFCAWEEGWTPIGNDGGIRQDDAFCDDILSAEVPFQYADITDPAEEAIPSSVPVSGKLAKQPLKMTASITKFGRLTDGIAGNSAQSFQGTVGTTEFSAKRTWTDSSYNNLRPPKVSGRIADIAFSCTGTELVRDLTEVEKAADGTVTGFWTPTDEISGAEVFTLCAYLSAFDYPGFFPGT